MKKYAKLIAAIVSGSASAIMFIYAWPIITQPAYSDIRWMVLVVIVLIFVAFYQLFADILKELL